MKIDPANTNFDLHLLRCFEALLAERNVSRAAAKLYLSQPAMSHALARLRVLFDDPLLVKAPGGMTPTARALALDEGVRAALSASYRLLEQPTHFSPAESRQQFNVMTAEYVEYLLLPRLVARLEQEAPHVRVRFRAAQRDRALEWLERGELDFRFGWWPESPPTLRAKRLMRDPLVCIARQGHPFIDGSLSDEQFMGSPHVLHERMGMVRQSLEQAVATRHRHLQVRLEVQDALALCNAVAHSDLLGTLPERFANALALKFPLQVLPLPLAVPDVRQAMYWHERTHKELGHQWFRGLVADLVKTL
jgi:DNA-binding transcriptional LysR family regulator